MYKRLLCLLLGLMLCCLPALGEEELEMTNDEITRLLWEMYQTENGDIDYTVLPDDYQTPIEGTTGITSSTPPMPMAGPSCCWKRWRPPSACRWTAMWPSTIN